MSVKKRIVIAGGTGFVGCALAQALAARGDEVVILTRDPASCRCAGRAVYWDGRTIGAWAQTIDGAHAVINLAGKNVNCRYTKKNLREIDESRVNAVRVMGEAIAKASHPPAVLIQASTTAIYGDAGERWCDETTPAGDGIPPRTASMWEQTFEASPTPQTRRTLLRISFVLGPEGGVMRTLSNLTRCFLGGSAGNGRQYISWIHIDDLTRIVLRAIDDPRMEGTYNLATRNPVTNAEFMRELRQAMHRPWSPPVPAWLVKAGCFVLRTEPVLALTGRRVSVTKLVARGFEFQHSTLQEALRKCVR